MNQSLHSDVPDQHRLSNEHPTDSPRSYALVLDLDIIRDNPVEAKHRRLVRSHRNGPLDRDLKPNPKIRDELNVSIMMNGLRKRINLIYVFRVSCLIHQPKR